jgi:crossover junction endodeoxyribonuclease RuvC
MQKEIKLILGIDPGANGAACLIDDAGAIIDVLEFGKCTEADIIQGLREMAAGYEKGITKAYIENVHSMPKQGVASSFKFGKGFGFIIGVVMALSIPLEYVTPQSWQKHLKCQSKGDKNVTKAMAQQLFPTAKCTHATSDAILIAEYGRQTRR